MLPSGSLEDRASKKTYEPGMGYRGWKSKEATGGAVSGAAGEEERLSVVGLRKRRACIAGAVNGQATTSAMQSNARRPAGIRLHAIVSRLLTRLELWGAGRPPPSDPPDCPDRDGGRGDGGQN